MTNEDGSPVNNVVVDLNTVGYIEIELTEEILEAAYTQKYWGGVFILNGDGNVEVTKVTLKTALDWNSEPVNIEFNEDGFIPASAFEGYNDYAKVQFTYNVAGSLSSYQNWGIGAVQSSDGNTNVVNLPASSLGDITVGCFKKDLQPAFDATPEGLLFNVWGFGDGVCVGSRVKVEVFDVVSTGINAVRSEVENENAPIYNLAGQRVDKSYKGVVIQNGKKFIQK